MNKPKTWQELPYRIKEWFLENYVQFDYDSYEGGREEELYAVLNWGSDYSDVKNLNRIKNAYENLDEASLIYITRDLLNGLEDERKTYLNLLGEKD